MTLRRAHRLNAWALGSFVLLHIGNHLFILAGAEAHLAVLEKLRQLYRLPGVEHAIFGLFALQILLGASLLVKNRSSGVPWRRVQRISGVVLGLFLVQHLSAVLVTRWAYVSVDTNTYWAAAVVSRAPLSWYFVPYYCLGVIALGAHLGAALRPNWPRGAMVGAAVGVAILIVAGFAGIFQPVILPPEHQAYLSDAWGIDD